VVGSAIQSFEEVCPERIDLIHKNYRKLCNLLIDVDEWGQVVIINMLTRYARTQFVDPNSELNIDKEEKNEEANEEENNSEKEDDYDKKFNQFNRSGTVILDPDHRLLLRVTKPLLQSRNSAVIFK
jgi:AP-3 complex subunit beta